MILVRFLLIQGGWQLEVHVLTRLWAWFVVPAFGLPALGYWPMAGLDLFWSLFTWRTPLGPIEGEDESDKLAKAAARVLGPLVVWAIGWAIHTYGIGA